MRRIGTFTLGFLLALGWAPAARAGDGTGYALLQLAAHLTGIARPQCDGFERARQFLNEAVGAERTPVVCTERTFFNSDGFEPGNLRFTPAISADGRIVAFEAGGVAFGAREKAVNLFVTAALAYDRLLGATSVVSVSSAGASGDRSSGAVAVSGDGRFVAFQSEATDLVPSDGNNRQDVFVRDLALGTTERVSVADGGGDPNGASSKPSISWDGRFVAFASAASNLRPPGEDGNGRSDVFVRDRLEGTTVRASVSSAGAEGDGASDLPRINASPDPALDGRWVAFASHATNLVADDGPGVKDVFVRDLEAETTERVSVSSDEVPGDADSGAHAGLAPSIGADGRFVAFDSLAENLVAGDDNGVEDAFLRDRTLGTTERVSVDPLASDGPQGDGASFGPAVSADGRFVSFQSAATNFHGASGRAEVWVRDREEGETRRISVADDGAAAQDSSAAGAALSADGRYVAFDSASTNLVPADGNDLGEVFVREWERVGPSP